MTDYFTGVSSKPALKGSEQFTSDDARPDLMREHYKIVRTNALTKDKIDFNIVVQGPLSKFSLLETFKARYLDSGKLPDWKVMIANKEKNKKKTKSIPTLNIRTVRLHGLDPLKLETFVHAMFGDDEETIVSSRKQIQKDCEEIFDIIVQLRSLIPERIHLLLSSDIINASKKLTSLKFKLNLIFYEAPYTESFYNEKVQLLSDFDIGATGDQTLFSDRVDLQSLKDVHQALGNTASIMMFILKDFVEKSEAAEREDEFGELAHEENDENRLINKRKSSRTPARTKKKQPTKKKEPNTKLDFQHLLRYCESNFIVRRDLTLRGHLGELVDHNIISIDETGTKIECLVDVKTCKKFIDFIESEPLAKA